MKKKIIITVNPFCFFFLKHKFQILGNKHPDSGNDLSTQTSNIYACTSFYVRDKIQCLNCEPQVHV